MRTYFILIGMVAWITWGLTWVLPLKRRLLKMHGMNKSNDYFLELAKQGDPDSKPLKRRTTIVMVVGIVFGLTITLSKYF